MPTEELFGAYHFLLEVAGPARSKLMAKVNQAGLKISDKGLDQALRGEIVTSPSDRYAIAKVLRVLSER